MPVLPGPSSRPLALAIAFAAFLAGGAPSHAADFSVSPIKAELRAGALTETIAITNHADARLRVSVRLMEWSQDDKGKDVYKESADLVYFPRQIEFEPGARKVVRIGMKAPPGAVERSYRLFIDEMADPLNSASQAAVAFSFRFAVAVFVAPATAKADFQLLQPRVERGKVVVPVRNTGNQHVRLDRVTLTDGSHKQEIAGWYSLANTSRDYVLELPEPVCRRGPALTVTAEAPGLRLDRQIQVDPGHCS